MVLLIRTFWRSRQGRAAGNGVLARQAEQKRPAEEPEMAWVNLAPSWPWNDILGANLAILGPKLVVLDAKLAILVAPLALLGANFAVLGANLAVLGANFALLGANLAILGTNLAALGASLAILGGNLAILPDIPVCVCRAVGKNTFRPDFERYFWRSVVLRK